MTLGTALAIVAVEGGTSPKMLRSTNVAFQITSASDASDKTRTEMTRSHLRDRSRRHTGIRPPEPDHNTSDSRGAASTWKVSCNIAFLYLSIPRTHNKGRREVPHRPLGTFSGLSPSGAKGWAPRFARFSTR